MLKPNLFLCFDAFNTLIRPNGPIGWQYYLEARSCGLNGFTPKQVEDSFKIAFKKQTKLHPNYGQATDMGAEKWWSSVIQETFLPLLPDHPVLRHKRVPVDLINSLLGRFACSKGYLLTSPDLPRLIRALHHQPPAVNGAPDQRPFDEIVVGVATNSDARIPLVLESLGLRVSPFRRFRHPHHIDNSYVIAAYNAARWDEPPFDVDFFCASYDVGAQKPDRRLFSGAYEMFLRVLYMRARDTPARSGSYDLWTHGQQKWVSVFVGDDPVEDGQGALSAGWDASVVVMPDGDGDGGEIWPFSNEGKNISDVVSECDAAKRAVGERGIGYTTSGLREFLRLETGLYLSKSDTWTGQVRYVGRKGLN